MCLTLVLEMAYSFINLLKRGKLLNVFYALAFRSLTICVVIVYNIVFQPLSMLFNNHVGFINQQAIVMSLSAA